MNIACAAGTACVLAVATSASAGFIGVEVTSAIVNGKSVFGVYLKSNSSLDAVLSITGAGAINIDFFDDDRVGPPFFSYGPQFSIPGNGLTDTYVTIGGVPGFANATQADAGWGPSGFIQPLIPAGAGWFNANPANNQGLVNQSTLRTPIAQFVFVNASAVIPFNLSFTANWNQGTGTPTQSASFAATIPAPTCIAALAALTIGRRRLRLR